VLRVAPRSWNVLRLTLTPRSRSELQSEMGLKSRARFQTAYLNPLIVAGLLQPTIPDRPNAPTQQYRITELGRALLERHSQNAD
jgi:ATP-dependent DNA helicase RecG